MRYGWISVIVGVSDLGGFDYTPGGCSDGYGHGPYGSDSGVSPLLCYKSYAFFSLSDARRVRRKVGLSIRMLRRLCVSRGNPCKSLILLVLTRIKKYIAYVIKSI
ncbi:MAG: hypothetical protein H8E12_01740 [Rhodobacteraceae bacterium]|nr:hypothetical protein [Paracoccaceae bacterium]